ncbi:MAG: hypothetical protein EOO07_23010 [Chitinophagaceae bacterium]|nr:MAG: hypothetical protein EOO07_23010 [Chitinophagaceae bacterium]
MADMAVRLERYADAETWMKTQLSNNPSVNYLAQWAEIQILQGKDENVISYLTPIVNSAPEIDDTLLLQLALAEKSLLIKSGDKKFDNIWGKKLSERVNLREQRQDIQHANEVARFYLDIQSQPEKALHWATLHTQHSREINDKKLLERAKNSVSYSRNLQKKETR